MWKVVFWIRLLLYLVPLGSFLLFSWDSCGRNIWIGNSLIQVEGVLTKAYFENVSNPSKQYTTKIKVEYSYIHGQEQYEGKNLTFCPLFVTNTNGLDRFREKFDALPKVGSKVWIWIDLANPENSALYKHMPRYAIPVALFVLLFGFYSLRKLDRYIFKMPVNQ